MKGFRGLVALVALLALPLVAVHAQGRGKGPRRAADVCASSAGNSGHVPYGQAKKCPPPPPNDSTPRDSTPQPPSDSTPPDTTPAPVPPPTGNNFVSGKVFADLDGNGAFDPFVGDTGLAGVTVELKWQGVVVGSATSDEFGAYRIDGLGNTGTNSYELCVAVPSGFTQAPPPSGTSYSGCGGTGYSFQFNAPFQQMFPGNFGMLPQ